MRLGILADIHEHIDHLRWALAVLRGRSVDRLVVLGDVFETGRLLRETVELLDGEDVTGVWGNHDFGLCGGNSTPDERLRYGGRTLDFMGRLRPRLEIDRCLFTHVEPWLDPEKLEDLWYFDGLPETPAQAARSFAAVPNRVMFVGHYHRWILTTADRLSPWSGDGPVTLRAGDRHLVAVHAVCAGRCALFDTRTNELVPFTAGRAP